MLGIIFLSHFSTQQFTYNGNLEKFDDYAFFSIFAYKTNRTIKDINADNVYSLQLGNRMAHFNLLRENCEKKKKVRAFRSIFNLSLSWRLS